MRWRSTSRRSSARLLGIAAALWLGSGWALADTLPLPPNLIDIRSAEGERLLRNSESFDSYVRLGSNFVTEQTQAFCGIASIAMVLNALGLPAPPSPEYAPYRMFDQNNLLDEQAERVLGRTVLGEQGMTLEQLGGLLALHGVEVEIRYAGESSPEQFRALAREYLIGPDRAVIVNYLRKAISQERGGHISPLGAYDAQSDRFLILDVARYKYPPVWVRSRELFDAMNTPDRQNGGRTRGFVLIRKTPRP